MGSPNFYLTARNNVGKSFNDFLPYDELSDDYASFDDFAQSMTDYLGEMANDYEILCDILNKALYNKIPHLFDPSHAGKPYPPHVEPSPSFSFALEHGYHGGFRLLIDSEFGGRDSDDVGEPYFYEDVDDCLASNDLTPQQRDYYHRLCFEHCTIVNEFCHYILRMLAHLNPALSCQVGGYTGGSHTVASPSDEEHEKFHAYFVALFAGYVRFCEQMGKSYKDELEALKNTGIYHHVKEKQASTDNTDKQSA